VLAEAHGSGCTSSGLDGIGYLEMSGTRCGGREQMSIELLMRVVGRRERGKRRRADLKEGKKGEGG
jgi:hypothetical protein